MSIQLDGLTKRYGGLAVVSRVSLDIANGEMFVLLGPSGSGKSTLLRMIAGLAEVDEGRVWLDGRDVTHVSPSKRGIGFVFQSYALFRNMTVADNVEFSLRVRGTRPDVRRRRREELLELVGLAGFGERRPAQLSGGQQQRVALARALADAPAFLLLDEPFGALDARIRTELRQTLRRIQRECRVTAVFVTHDQEEALELADRIGVMNFGRLLEVGAPQELYLRPRSAFVAGFLGVSNLVVGESTPTSVRLGSVDLPLGTETPVQPRGQRAQILLRPEDLEIRADREHMRSAVIGVGRVEERGFSGPVERLRIRLDPIPGVRQVAPALPYGASELVFEVTRPQPEAVARTVKRGDMVWVGVRRCHVLAPASVEITLFGGTRPGSHARDFAGRFAESLHGSVRYPDEAALLDPMQTGDTASQSEVVGFGLTAMDFEDAEARQGEFGPGAPMGHVLVVPGPSEVPRRLLICVAVGEPGKVDVRVAERIAWRLDAEATVMTVLPEGKGVPEHVTRFLEASARVLSSRGVRTRTLIRHGSPSSEVLSEIKEGGHDLLVVGAPFRGPGEPHPFRGGVMGRLLRERPSVPMLIVRSQES
ncbi:MAG: ATP-binding cassette domain-containing protein [Gemmatimonadetes bacterium]|nr:ATP-binding cassette domain-containing protein [Gemmatimonadota bacterium]